MKSIVMMIGFVLLSVFSFSQATEGELIYDVYVTSDNPKTAAWIKENLQNSSAELYFADGKMRNNLFLGNFMTQTTIAANDRDTTLSLMDGMMGKIAMKISKSDTSYDMAKGMEPEKVELADDTKKVMGYTCKKAIVTMKKGNQATIWYTTKINPSYRGGRFLIKGIPGAPLEIHSTWGGKMKLKMVAYKFKNKVKKPDEVFDFSIPKGFTFMTMEQMKQMRGNR